MKANQQGEVDRMKARLCARGYLEIWGQDYVETHAPVTCLVSWRVCLAQAAHLGLKVAILDIKSAYLMAHVEEDIYMSVPEGVTAPAPGMCLKLNKSIYGLKQAGRCWARLLQKKMIELGMRQSVADPCLYLNDQDGELMTVSVFVDDMCICYSDEQRYQDFRKRLENQFQISKSDDSNSFLGMIIERTQPEKYGQRGPVFIHQRPYIEDILSRYKHQDCKPAATAAEPGLKLSKAQMPTTEAEKAEMKDVPYRQLTGALLYLANCTRPDIAHAVGSCARFGSNPGKVHWQALKRVLRYLAGTRDMGIMYGQPFAEGVPHNCIHGYVDGDWGGDADDRRSTTGYIYMSWSGPVSWRSKKQASTALSSCESEYMAASEAAKEAIWLTRLLKEDLKLEDVSLETKGDLSEREYQGDKPLTVFEDNVGCIQLSRNPVSHRSSKHIEIRYHFVRERVQDGSLKLVFIPSSENIADVLTKSTRRNTFLYLRAKILVQKPSKAESARVAPGRALMLRSTRKKGEHNGTLLQVAAQIRDESLRICVKEGWISFRPDVIRMTMPGYTLDLKPLGQAPETCNPDSPTPKPEQDTNWHSDEYDSDATLDSDLSDPGSLSPHVIRLLDDRCKIKAQLEDLRQELSLKSTCNHWSEWEALPGEAVKQAVEWPMQKEEEAKSNADRGVSDADLKYQGPIRVMRRRNPEWRHDTLSRDEAAEMAIQAWENDAAFSNAWYTCVQEMKERIGTAERRRRLARARTVQHKLWSLPVKMKENVTNWSRYEHMPHIHRMVIWKGLNWLSNRLGMDFRDGGLVADWIGMFFLDRTDKRLIEIIRLDAEYAMQLLGELLPKWVCPRRCRPYKGLAMCNAAAKAAKAATESAHRARRLVRSMAAWVSWAEAGDRSAKARDAAQTAAMQAYWSPLRKAYKRNA